MNMISTGAFLPEMDASNKQETVAEKFARVWEKKNSKVARAGGVSLMALSLAACGSDSEDSDPIVDKDNDGNGDHAPQPQATTVRMDDLEGTVFTSQDDVALNGTTGQYVYNATFGAGDVLNGTGANDTLEITRVGDFTVTGETVSGIESASVDATGTVTLDASEWSGLTSLSTEGTGGVDVDAAGTTAVTAIDDELGVNAAAIDGGSDVNLTVSKMAAGTIDVGLNDEATGDVVVVANFEKIANTGDVDYTGGGAAETIDVVGGDTISVSVNSGASLAVLAADNKTITNADVDVDGDDQTTSVSVVYDAMVAEVDGTGATGAVGVTGGVVTIDDGNANTTGTDTLASVTLGNTGAATVTSTVLSTLNLTGASSATLGGNMDITLDTSGAGLETQTKALTINGSGYVGTIDGTHADDQTSLAIVASDDFAIADIDAMTALTSITASGAGVTTITAQTAATAITSYTSTGGGLVIASAIPTGASFTGGAGEDGVVLGATTKAIVMGAGDDSVTLTDDLGTGGTVDGGAGGNDTLVLDVAAATFSDPSAQPRISGFETLKLGASADGSYSAAGFAALTHGAVTGAVTYANVAADADLTITASPTVATIVTLANATGTEDDISVTLTSDGDMAADSITLNGIETINLESTDSKTSTLNDNTVTIVSDKATTLNVSGNVDIAITSSSAAKITTFDASEMVITKVTENGVEYTSANATVGEVVSITGSNGVDILTGSSTANDTIIGGEGADTIAYNGGSDTLTGGAGKDTFDILATGATSAYATIADATTGDMIDLSDAAVTNSADITARDITATNWNLAEVTLGAAATLADYLDAASEGADGTTEGQFEWFEFDGNSYIVVSNDNTDDYTSGTDTVVIFAGTGILDDASMADGVLTIA